MAEGLDALKNITIGVLLVGMVVVAGFLMIGDMTNNSIVTVTPDNTGLNQTFNKSNEVNSLATNMTDTVLSKETQDTSALSTMLSGGYQSIRIGYKMIGIVVSLTQETALYFGISPLLLVFITSIISVIFLFIILKAIFGAGGGS